MRWGLWVFIPILKKVVGLMEQDVGLWMNVKNSTNWVITGGIKNGTRKNGARKNEIWRNLWNY